MHRAFARLTIMAAAALVTTSPVHAQTDAPPVCFDGSVTAYGYHGSYAATSVQASQFCTDDSDSLTIVSVGNWPEFYLSYSGGEVFIDGLYYSSENLPITVTDGVNFTTFNVTIYPIFY